MSEDKKRRERLRVRPAHVLFLAVAVACTIALAWWQWTRFRSGSGTFQNLGYALQWPMFGAFFVYAYRKFMQYENEKIDHDNEVLDAADGDDSEAGDEDAEMARLYQADAAEFDDHSAETVAEFLPERPTMDVAEFNAATRPRRGSEDLGGLAEIAGREAPRRR